MFTQATKTQTWLRMALSGPSGSGKTYTALTVAQALGQRVAVIDTEHGSSQKYADRFAFDVAVLQHHHPVKGYGAAITAAVTAGYDVLIIDSLSHAWMGRDGALELVDKARTAGRDGFTAWGEVTPLHNQLLDTILAAPLHIIATLRTKTAYELEKDERGRTTISKLGLQPIQRDGVEYEFDVIGDMTLDNTLIVTKSRMAALHGRVIALPDAALAQELAAWLRDGDPEPAGASFTPVQQETWITRILTLLGEARELGLRTSIDPATLVQQSKETLLQIGTDLRAQVQTARAAQPTAKGAHHASNGRTDT